MAAIIEGWRNLKKKMVLGISEINNARVVYCLVVGLLVSRLVFSHKCSLGSLVNSLYQIWFIKFLCCLEPSNL